jgi:hypothetical protein
VTTAYLTQHEVERRARELVRTATRRLDLASPWVEGYPIQRLLAEALPRVRAGVLSVRVAKTFFRPESAFQIARVLRASEQVRSSRSIFLDSRSRILRASVRSARPGARAPVSASAGCVASRC